MLLMIELLDDDRVAPCLVTNMLNYGRNNAYTGNEAMNTTFGTRRDISAFYQETATIAQIARSGEQTYI